MDNYDSRLSITIDDDSFGLDASSQNNNMGINCYSKKRSPSLDNLFSNRDVLARRLKNRPDRDDLIDRNIIPAFAHTSTPTIFDKVAQLERRKTGDFLQKKIRARPNRQQLIQRHILSGDSKVDPSLLEKVGKLERQKIADQLNERLLTRPGPIELIQDRILAVESPIQHAVDQGNVDFENTVSPASSLADSPSVSELETGINTLNCTSPSPPPNESNFSEAFRTQLKSVSDRNITAIPPVFDTRHASLPSQISISQKENERLVRSLTKKARQSKPKVKKLKFHECQPGSLLQQSKGQLQQQLQQENDITDERYKRLLEQQTLYLRLQVMQQNAVMNALQGNPQSIDAVNEEIESMISKEQNKLHDPLTLKSIDGKKFDDLRVIDLRAQLKQRGLLVSGSKAKLIERLSAFEDGKAAPTDFAYSGNFMHDSNKAASMTSQTSDVTPVTTVMQVTAYATNSGQTYQVIQTVPQSPPSSNVMQYQVLPTHCTPSSTLPQLRLDQVNSLPVVAVTQPNIVTVQEALNENKSLLATDNDPNAHSNIQFQITPPQQPPSPTVMLHSGPPLQQASLMQRDRTRVQVHKLPVISQGQCYVHDNTILSQSVPAMQYNNNYIIHSQQTHTNLNYQNSLSNSSLNSTGDGEQQFRSRASSEPSSQLERLHRNDSTTTTSMHSDPNSQLKMSGSCSPSPGSYIDGRRSTSSIKSETYDDIMDIIGEMSSPSPTFAPKCENPPSYNSCVFDANKVHKQHTVNKYLNMNKHHQQHPQQQQHYTGKSFNSSVPENMNLISDSPNQNFLANPFSGSSNLNFQHSNNFNNLNHSSSTGSIPQQIQTDNNILSTSPFRASVDAPSTFMNCNTMSPVSPSVADDTMELDKFPGQNNALSWLDLNMETSSPPSLNYQGFSSKDLPAGSSNMSVVYNEYQHIYNNPHAVYGAQNRSQTSIHGSSPKPQDGCISLFDLESGGY